MSRLLRIAVLASGRGSNLRALIDAKRSGTPIDIVLVAGDKPHAPALRIAEDAGIATLALDPKAYDSRAAFDTDFFRRVGASTPDLIVLAGFMRILDAAALAPWIGRMINIHPSLLPKYRGLRTHDQALAAGDAMHGASVHVVTAELDGGPVIAQVALKIRVEHTAATLAADLLPLEHRLLVACVDAIARGRIALHGGGVEYDGRPLHAPLVLDANGTLAVNEGSGARGDTLALDRWKRS